MLQGMFKLPVQARCIAYVVMKRRRKKQKAELHLLAQRAFTKLRKHRRFADLKSSLASCLKACLR